MIKKTLLAFSAVLALTSSAFATEKIEKEVFISTGVYSTDSEVLKDNNLLVSAGFGISKVKDNNIFCGLSLDLAHSDVSSKESTSLNQTSISLEQKIGYHWNTKSNAYAITGVRYSDFGAGIDGYGPGIGAGIDYRLNKDISAAIEAKKYFMNTKGDLGHIDSTQAVMKVAYHF